MLCLSGDVDNRNVDVFMISSATEWVIRCAVRTVDVDLCAHTARGEVQWFTPPLLDDAKKDVTLAHTNCLCHEQTDVKYADKTRQSRRWRTYHGEDT